MPAFARVAAASGIAVLRTPVRAPRANAVCERFLGSVRRECLDHIIVNEAHLRAVLTEYVRYDNAERPHRALGLDTPIQRTRSATGPIRASAVLGGRHHIYQRAA
ncbi:MAG TPA: integrase core domain-containing protein [Chloroflexota bacterium]|nr:integrase core domain-containing protein [Chloroflexota bacterium]